MFSPKYIRKMRGIQVKILILNASPKKNGNTARVLQFLHHGISGHDVEWIHAYDLSVTPCLGCFQCRPDRECVLPEDDAQRIGRKIDGTDLLIIGTPNYWGNMSGPLKTLFDRWVTVIETFAAGPYPKPRLHGKKAIIVTTSGSPWPLNLLPSQSAGTVRAVKTILTKGGFGIAGIINFGGAKPAAEIPVKIQRLAEQLGNKVSRGGTGRIIR